MKTVCCANMPFAEDAFRTLGDAVSIDGRVITAADVRDTDLLAIRSTTRVSAALLESSPVRFVGTATIGIDHMDTAYLESRGIHWCYSPGCNANSVAEYVVAALLCLAQRHGFTLAGRTLGIIGVGNVGRRVVEKADALGLRVLQNDPPRQRVEPGNANQFVARDRLLAESDIVTVHVPLTREGRDATFRMADAAFFRQMRPGAIFINAARGPVMDSSAVLGALESGRVAHAVLDTWEDEPGFDPVLLAHADIGTPHIAGHSFEGKAWGTAMVYEEACRFLGVEASWSLEPNMPPPPVPAITVNASDRESEEVLWQVVRRVYDIIDDDLRLREGAAADRAGRADHFDRLRKMYPMRREFRYTTLTLEGADTATLDAAEKLQFRLRPS